jgi:hypothetical protein
MARAGHASGKGAPEFIRAAKVVWCHSRTLAHAAIHSPDQSWLRSLPTFK